VACRSYTAWTLWYLGYPDQGLTRSHEAGSWAQQSAHPFSLGFALGLAAKVHEFRREGHAAQEHAEAASSLAVEQGFPHWRARIVQSHAAGRWRSRDRRRKGWSRLSKA
jgi:hypothetical protein